MSSGPVFRLPVAAAGAASVARGGAAALVLVGALVAAIGLGVGVGLLTHNAMFAAACAGGALVLALRAVEHLRSRPGDEPIERAVSVERDQLVVEGMEPIARAQLHACRYDPMTNLVWLLGPLRWPMVCIDVGSIEGAVRLCDALALPDRDVRSFRTPSLLAGVPWIGVPVAALSIGIALYGLAMLTAAPLRLAMPIALVGLTLAVASFAPATIVVRDDAIVRSWLGWRRVVPMLDVRAVSVQADRLVLETRRGTLRWTLRIAHDSWYWDTPAAERAQARHGALIELVERRLGHAIARTFD